MSILEIKNLSHLYDKKILFDKANLNINNGEHTGVVGLNGAGKTTFINILAGKVMQDEGEVKWLSGISIGYLDQHADIEREETVMEYLKSSFADLYRLNERMETLYAEMGGVEDADELDKMINKANNLMETLNRADFFELEAKIKKVAGGLGIAAFGYDSVVGTLSGGQRAKLMLAKLLLTKPTVMLLDEPTNFLDIEHIDWLIEFLNGYDGTFLVISHDTEFLDKVCRFIVGIENGNIIKYSGNYREYLVQREENMRQYEDNYLRQQQEIEKMQDYINRNKARAATAGMANARKKMLEKMDIIKKPTVIYDAIFSFPHVALHTQHLLDVDKLEIGYSNPLLPPITLNIGSESKLWIRGTNGIGKTTLIKTLMGTIPALSGSFTFHPQAKFGYVEQELSFKDLEINANAFFSNAFPRLNHKDVLAALAKVGIKNQLATNPICELSGGEQVRIKLALLTNRETNVLVLDEPTNHLDIRAKSALKEALIQYKGCILLVSHEKEFAEGIATDVFDAKF